MKQILSLFKKDAVLSAAWLLALFSMAAVPPGPNYISYIDVHTLGLLFCLMLTMAGLQSIGFFRRTGEALLLRIRSLRQLELLLTLLCFFSSMLITNDVALITFVPFAIELLRMIRREDRLIPVVVMQTVAANSGSMTTPIGNPQNLYLYAHYRFTPGEFLRIMLPFSLLSLFLILLFLLRGSRQTLSFSTSALQGGTPAAGFDKRRFFVYLFMFLLCLGTVSGALSVSLLLLSVTPLSLLCDRSVFAKADYSLLFTFTGFFIFIGNMKQISWFSDALRELLSGSVMLCSAAVSQVISNVPAALLLSGFTDRGAELLIGVNLGGLGTLIASMASLISYKYVAKEFPEAKGRYLMQFTAINILFLLILLLAAALL